MSTVHGLGYVLAGVAVLSLVTSAPAFAHERKAPEHQGVSVRTDQVSVKPSGPAETGGGGAAEPAETAWLLGGGTAAALLGGMTGAAAFRPTPVRVRKPSRRSW